jgi:hypothetical protein
MRSGNPWKARNPRKALVLWKALVSWKVLISWKTFVRSKWWDQRKSSDPWQAWGPQKMRKACETGKWRGARRPWKAWPGRTGRTGRPGRQNCRPFRKGSGSSTSRFQEPRAGRTRTVSVRLPGAPEIPALQAAPAAVVRRHRPLRTVHREPEGRCGPESRPPEASFGALRAAPVPPARLHRTLARTASAGIAPITERPLWVRLLRARLLRVFPRDHVLVVVVHEIAADDRSPTLPTDDGCVPGAVRPGAGRWRARRCPGRRAARALRGRGPDRPAGRRCAPRGRPRRDRRWAGRRRTPRSAAAPRRCPGSYRTVSLRSVSVTSGPPRDTSRAGAPCARRPRGRGWSGSERVPGARQFAVRGPR